jgi:CHAD domain-containing protein
MAFQLRREETVEHGIRRLARRELASARDALRHKDPPDDDGIHEARKSVKKVRVILHLMKSDAASGLGGCRRRLRRVNRTLSKPRDAAAIIESLSALKSARPDVFTDTGFAALLGYLQAQKRSLMEEAACRDSWTRAASEFSALRRAAKRWAPAHRQFGALARGIRSSYERGREAMIGTERHRTAVDFHDWRKRIKALWYELRLIEPAHADIRRELAALHDAQNWLGEDHNIVVLCGTISNDPTLRDQMIDWSRLRQGLEEHQRSLRDKTIAVAERLYAIAPDDYVRALKGTWKAWHASSEVRRSVPGRRRTNSRSTLVLVRNRLLKPGGLAE